MSVINVTNIEVLNNNGLATENLSFVITFESLENLVHDTEWKLVFVGNPDSSEEDQELDGVVIGPIKRGIMRFKLDSPPPDLTRLASDEVHGIAALMLSAYYNGQEFVRIGWYVQNHYLDPQLNADPPELADFTTLKRLILTDEPRLTKFSIGWDTQIIPTTGDVMTRVGGEISIEHES